MERISLSLLLTIIIIVSLIFFIAFILSKTTYFKKSKLSKWLVSIMSGVLLYYLFTFIVFSLILHEAKINYNKKTWLEDKTIRYKMVDNLVNSKVLIGKNKSEVIKLFGKPNSTNLEENTWNYIIIGHNGLSSLIIKLNLFFSKDDVVKKVKKKVFVD